jgi:hypothetical protein
MIPDFERTGRLEFHLPGQSGETALLEAPYARYRQLVCWCLIQRFRYYVLERPKVSDRKYDEVERYIARMEQRYGLDNPYSPTKEVGSSDPSSYPHSVFNWFRKELDRDRIL